MTTALVRRDGRGQREMRGRELRTSELNQFDGSAWYSQGLTAVVAAVNGPVAARQEDYRTCDVRVYLTRAVRLPHAGGADRLCVEQQREEQQRADGEAERFLASCVEAVVLLERFPRCVLEAHLTVLSDDGALLAVAANALMCALLDAGVPCRTTIAAVCLAACADGNSGPSASSPAASSSVLLLDPTLAEEAGDEAQSYATATFVVANPSSSDKSSSGGVLASHVEARPGSSLYGCRLRAAELASMTTLAERAATILFDFFRNCNVPLE
ncbi:putative exosome complex exonuclease 1 [Trypanosoma grayi]|uniref:putative exosome complex exonuclease 1 n=1 Tax=Trypanosoma grayi TaxID=71804 RepID=UPI0004F4BD75|nr:putative exosome complex exonuclease 1 [Trypanosoma grayi]KEG09994.1 putative exosome complex exonuclease 1 [Trypanosoma grayi]